MTYNLQDRRKETIPLSLPMGGDAFLNLRYKTSYMTPGTLADLNRTREAAKEALEKLNEPEAAPEQPTVNDSSEAALLHEFNTLAPSEETTNDEEKAALSRLEATLEQLDELSESYMTYTLETVTEWDLMDGDVKVPLTREGLIKHDVDFDLMAYILGKIKDAKTPEKKSKTPSTGR